MAQRFISYYRVSTQRQSKSGLGLEAQETAVERHLGDVELIAAYTEIESGKRNDRPELAKALDHCRRAGASLCIARLDRLSRNARFLLEILDSGVSVEFCDLPQLGGAQGRFMLTALAGVAELEGALISQRTKAALAAARRRGVRLGNPQGARALRQYEAVHGHEAAVEGAKRAANDRAEPYRDILADLISQGLSLNRIAAELNSRGERTVRGGRWTAKAVSRIVKRLNLTQGARGYSQAA